MQKSAQLIPFYSSFLTKAEQVFVVDFDADFHLDQLNQLSKKESDYVMEDFTQRILAYICEVTKAYKGIFFVMDESYTYLQAKATYACLISSLFQCDYQIGEGMIGQVAQSKKSKIFKQLSPKTCKVDFSSFYLHIDSIYYTPILFNEKVLGVLELYFLNTLSPPIEKFILEAHTSFSSKLENIFIHLLQEKYIQEAKQQKEIINSQKEELLQNWKLVIYAYYRV